MIPPSPHSETLAPEPITWQGGQDRVVLSPRAGGRIVSWTHGGSEWVKPLGLEDGGLLRMMLGEERYPGSSYNTPHLARILRHDAGGMAVHLRYVWSTANALARRFGWPHKVNPVYLDGLLLDKIVTFDAASSSVTVDLAITNLTGQERHITPWLQSHFFGWVDDAFVLIDGEARPYLWHNIFWDGHRAEPGKTMRLVHASRDRTRSVVLGASTEWLTGMASYTRPDYGGNSTDGCMELRGKTVALAPRQRWRANAFLALGNGVDAWQHWAAAAPAPLFSRVEPADEPGWDESALLPLLRHWALPVEREAGLMVLAPLDKVPFTSAERYGAANSFSDFHSDATGLRARAEVVLFPLRPFEAVDIALSAGTGWRTEPATAALCQHEPLTLALEGPASLAGLGDLRVMLRERGRLLAELRVEPDAAVGPRYDFQVKQVSAYLDERWHAEKGGFAGTTPADFQLWRTQARQRLRHWMRSAVTGEAPLVPRLMERQSGPQCIREKILIQTEPDLWLPMYLVRPRHVPAGRALPAILFPHGSCAGKSLFAPDETGAEQDPGRFDEWPSPYQLAHRLGCLVLIPDRRGWGEWSEANHGQRTQRAWKAGYNMAAMDVWDHVRALDYLAGRPDVDASRIACMGGSGGGWMTVFMMGADERLAGGIVSSTLTTLPALPGPYFFRTLADENDRPVPPPEFPLAPATILSLAAPRPLWVMDGRADPCYALSDKRPRTPEETRAAFDRWQAECNAGREAIARVYRLLGAEDRFRATWFEGGHLAGFTFNTISGWLTTLWGSDHSGQLRRP